MKAILIGSKAAELRGILPLWRNGETGDTDIVCDRDFLDLFCGWCGLAPVPVSETRGIVPYVAIGTVNYNLTSPEILSLMDELTDDEYSAPWTVGQSIKVATKSIIYATLLYTTGLNERNAKKSIFDLIEYETELDEDHLLLAELCRKESVAILHDIFMKEQTA